MIRFIVLAFALLLWGCDAAPAPDAAPQEAPPEAAAAGEPGEPELLPTPFTAEQIRDEWVEGLTLVMHTRSPGGESRDRWTVKGGTVIMELTQVERQKPAS